MPSRSYIAVVLLIALCATAAQALPPAPELLVTRAPKGAAKLIWEIPARLSQAVISLEIERAAPPPPRASFQRIAVESAPKARGAHVDRPIYDGRYIYRLRIRTAKGYSGWSNRAGLMLRPSRNIPARTPFASGQRNCARGSISEVIKLVNRARAAAGAAPLKNHRQLAWSARTHAIKMAASGRFSHDGWVDYIRQSGFRGSSLAENIAWGYPDPSSVMNGWLNSPGHRANILNPRTRYIGVGCVLQGSTWWVQDFAG